MVGGAVQCGGSRAATRAGAAGGRARSRWRSPSRAAAASVSAAPRPRRPRDPAAEASARSRPSGQAALARFYDQQLTWSACQGFQCARLTVPLDYAKPGGATVSIAVLKAEATGHAPRLARGQPRRPGRLGRRTTPRRPTSSSASRCATATTSSGSTPAGSAAPSRSTASTTASSTPSSAPTRPRTPRPRSRPSPPTPRTSPRRARPTAGPLLGHVSTLEAAKDMDILRAAARRREAELPRQVLRHLPRRHLRRPVPPQASAGSSSTASSPPTSARPQVNQGQAEGFETRDPRLRRGLRRAAAAARSAARSTSGMQRLRDFLDAARRQPPIQAGDPHVTAAHRGLGLARHRRGDVRPGRVGQR